MKNYILYIHKLLIGINALSIRFPRVLIYNTLVESFPFVKGIPSGYLHEMTIHFLIGSPY